MQDASLNQLLHQCNQAALRNDIATGIEMYTRAINETSDSWTRNFLVSHLRDLHILLSIGKTDQPSNFCSIERGRRMLVPNLNLPGNFCGRALAHCSFIYEATLASERIFLSVRKVDEMARRIVLFSRLHIFYGACHDCHLIARMTSMGPQIWQEIGLSAVRCGRNDLCEFACAHIRATRTDLRPIQVREAILRQEYGVALKILNEMRPRDTATQFTHGMMGALVGDAEKGAQIFVRAERLRNTADDAHALFDVVTFLSNDDIMQGIVSDSIFAKYLFYVSSGVYQSLTMNLIDVPIDLFIPWQIQVCWIAKRDVSIKELQRNVFPDDFNKDPIDTSKEHLLMGRGFDYGLAINPLSANVRQHICCGLALVQLVQYLQQSLKGFTMEKAVSSVGHWIRLYDPLACLFPRTMNSFVAYVTRNGVSIRQMQPYRTRVLNMLKEALTRTMDGDIANEISEARTPEEVYDAVMGDVCVKIGNSSIILKMGVSLNVDLAVAVPPYANEWHDKFAKLAALWCHLMFVLKAPRTPESAADFLSSSIHWLFDWMQMCPYADGSNIIGSIVFQSLICAYFSLDVDEVKPSPFIIQMEALLAPDYETFFSFIERSYHINFDSVFDIGNIPKVSEIFPTYHHRQVAIQKYSLTGEFRRLVTIATATSRDTPVLDDAPESV